MLKSGNKGFTLIELLVVIAIISLLASIGLGSFSATRNKAKDAAIKAEMVGLRTEVALYYNNNGNLGQPTTECIPSGGQIFMWNDPKIKQLVDAVKSKSALVRCGTTGNQWMFMATLNSSARSFCVDGTGAAIENSGSQVTNYECADDL